MAGVAGTIRRVLCAVTTESTISKYRRITKEQAGAAVRAAETCRYPFAIDIKWFSKLFTKVSARPRSPFRSNDNVIIQNLQAYPYTGKPKLPGTPATSWDLSIPTIYHRGDAVKELFGQHLRCALSHTICQSIYISRQARKLNPPLSPWNPVNQVEPANSLL